MSRKIAGKHLVVQWRKADRWKRLIGVLYQGDQDINLRMVDRGLAWQFKRYQREQTPEQRQAYSGAEIGARDARRGLWSDPAPVPPWEWRKR